MGPWEAKWIRHSDVRPFPQPEPMTVEEKVAVMLKPELHVSSGCHPYPAVNDLGETNGGLKTTGAPSGMCKGSGWGSQVYGRHASFRGVWAIMYVWYFPKDMPSAHFGHRHDWEHVIVWIEKPVVENVKILAVTPSFHDGYSKQVPPDPSHLNGLAAKFIYESEWPINHALRPTRKGGKKQDLILWEQMSSNARHALNIVPWGAANTPFNDFVFMGRLEKAFPF
uniref:NLP effector protein 3 n=1 Tax=Plasmopara viticola TaxID=143451 RepID=NLP3_PLAVT|nr:RecName: Full=NLP effector protein 3; AltName: Full=Nep1-like protein 3 [Plasmopara viticola]QHG11502.1 NEP1-like protein 3 [Plasmopara viticola]